MDRLHLAAKLNAVDAARAVSAAIGPALHDTSTDPFEAEPELPKSLCREWFRDPCRH